MIIYIEGVDGTGKTTLANAIKDRLELLYRTGIKGSKRVVFNNALKVGTMPNNPNRLKEDDLKTLLVGMIVDTTTVYICDRGPLSDIIYRTFDKHKPVISFADFWSTWLQYQGLFIVVGCDSNSAYKLMLTRGDDNTTAKTRHSEIRYLYQQLFPMFGAIKYDVKKHGKKDNDDTEFTKMVNRIVATSLGNGVKWEEKYRRSTNDTK